MNYLDQEGNVTLPRAHITFVVPFKTDFILTLRGFPQRESFTDRQQGRQAVRQITYVPVSEVRGIRDQPLQTETGTHRRLPGCVCFNGSWHGWRHRRVPAGQNRGKFNA